MDVLSKAAALIFLCSVFTLCFYAKPLELSDFFCHRAIVFGGQLSGYTGYDADHGVEDLLHGLLAHPCLLYTSDAADE